jgi:benzodiazapine receptor
MTLSSPIKILIAVVGTVAIGSASGLITADAINTWYAGINKPSFNPPNWIFGPVWTLLYILMGVAAGLVWSSTAEATVKRRALAAYILQLGLNALWSILFFGLRSPQLALTEIVLLWIAIVWCMRLFEPIQRTAAYLLVPYLLWVSFASVLNGAIVWLN